MTDKRIRKNRLTSLLLGGGLLLGAVSAAADISTEKWTSTFYPDIDRYDAWFYGVDFLDENTLLAGGMESAGINGTSQNLNAMGIRYNAETGVPLDTPSEWIQYSIGGNARFLKQSIGTSGNIYFAGLEYGGNSGAIWKYAPDGTLAAGWPRYFPNVSWAYDVAEDSAGNVYGVGTYAGGFNWDSSARDWAIFKYQSNGILAAGFPLSYYDHAGDYDTAYRVVVDSEDNFIVSGIITQDPETGDNHQDWLVRKYESDGTMVWEKVVGTANTTGEWPRSMVVDSNDDIIVAGDINNGTDRDTHMVKFAKADGSIMWEQTWDIGTEDLADDILLDDSENIYLARRVYNQDDRWRAMIQYHDGQTGDLLKSQALSHVNTHHGNSTTESDGAIYIALNEDRLAVASYTTDSSDPSDHKTTAFITVLDLLSDESFFVIPVPGNKAVIFGL